MGKFSKIFHHIESKDLRNKYEQKKVAKIQEEKKKEDTKKYIASAMEQVKHNWRSDIDVGEELREGMTTSSVATIAVNPTGDEGLNNTPLDSPDDCAPGARGDVADFYNGTVGTAIKSGGSGSGNDGGFDCTTILTSVGINILESQEGDRRFVDPSQVYNLNSQEQEAAIRNITTDSAADNFIKLNTNIRLKALNNQIDV